MVPSAEPDSSRKSGANAPLAAEDAGIDGLRGIQSASDWRAVGSSLQRPLNKPFYCVGYPTTAAPRFETIPSSPILQACRKTSSHHPTVCHADRQKRSPMTRVPTTHSPIWRPSANCVQRPPRSAALFLSAIRCTWRASGLNAGASIVSMTAFWATIRSRWQAAQFGCGTWRTEIASQTPRACYWESDSIAARSSSGGGFKIRRSSWPFSLRNQKSRESSPRSIQHHQRRDYVDAVDMGMGRNVCFHRFG
jgi:hypothetical protein